MAMAHTTRRWTLEEVHSLPDDGNSYELVHGELLVTPAPSDRHGNIVAGLTMLLVPYVAANGLGFVYHPRSVFRIGKEVEVEPDIMVRPRHPERDGSWETAPLPLLVVEVLSDTTRRYDQVTKRAVYMDAGIPEYWIVDGETNTVCVVKPGLADAVAADRLIWAPAGAVPLEIDLAWAFE